MQLLFEKSVENRRCALLPDCDVPQVSLPEKVARKKRLGLPELSEKDISRHYSALERRTFGVNHGFYPLGSCTMKWNPRINETAASLPGFTEIHPLQPVDTIQGCLEVLYKSEQWFAEITGMDAMTFQPAAGAHGELTGLMLIKKYHEKRGDTARTKIIVPDSAHGTNPATVSMCGYTAVNVESGEDGCVDLEKLRQAVGPDTAGLMLTNPNTLGIFDKNILEITKIIHEAGGLVYYDGANLNAIMGTVRPGDMGFDCIHLNLHKTFSTPHGGGGPGSGAVGCKEFLAPYLPKPLIKEKDGKYYMEDAGPDSMGKVKAFYGNFLVVVRGLTYVMTLGREGIKAASQDAVLNANYMMTRLRECFNIINQGTCMHEFVITMQKESVEHHVNAMDIAKGLLDHNMHPPTMYFPLIVPEALMVEPTETEDKDSIDQAADTYIAVYRAALADPEGAKHKPATTIIGRPDETKAARTPVVRYVWE